MIARCVRRLRELHRSDDGTSLVEFAIVVPMIALLLVGLIETGRFLSYGIRLGNAAHAGAQYGSAGEQQTFDPPGIAAAACGDATFTCTTATPKPGKTAAPDTMLVTSSVSCTYSDGSSDSACPIKSGVTRNMFVQVSTSGTFRPLLKYPIFPNSVPMSASATIQSGQ